MSEEKIERSVEKTVEETVEKVEEKVEDIQEKVEEAVEAKKSKLDIAKEKIDKAKILTAETRNQIEECMKNIDADIEKFNKHSRELFVSALHPSQKLLGSLGISEEILQELPDSKVEMLEIDDGKVDIKEVSSGRFKGFFLALLAGIATFMAWAFSSSSALKFPIPPEKIPDFPRLNKMLEWASEQLGQGANATIGAAALIIAILLIMWIVYSIVVSMKASKNLRVANETEEAVGLYCTEKEECKQKMKFVREHIQNSTKMLDKYRVLLQEQNAKINRALHFEETQEYEELHTFTKEDVKKTQKLISKVKRMLELPMAEAGVLTQEAIDSLKAANKVANDHIMELYT